MYALIAALIAIAVIAMMWRFLERETSASEDDHSETTRPPRPTMPRRTPKPRILAPDDDPDFLRELGKRINKNPNDERHPDAG